MRSGVIYNNYNFFVILYIISKTFILTLSTPLVMKIYNRDEVAVNQNHILRRIKEGKIFIYPTDTIYGIGCDATNEESVQKIRELKGRYDNPFSIIAPSKDWITENCEVSGSVLKWLRKLPGPYTLILKLKTQGSLARSVNNGLDTIGIRMPKHWIHDFFSNLNIPIITTSANKQEILSFSQIGYNYHIFTMKIKWKIRNISYRIKIIPQPITYEDWFICRSHWRFNINGISVYRPF